MVKGVIKSVPVKLPKLKVADSKKVPSALSSSYEFEKQEIEAEDIAGRSLFLSRRLYENWNVVLTLTNEDDQPVPLQAVRLGQLPGVSDGFEGPWSINLSRIPWDGRITALGRPIVLQLADGTRLSVTCLTDNYHRA